MQVMDNGVLRDIVTIHVQVNGVMVEATSINVQSGGTFTQIILPVVP